MNTVLTRPLGKSGITVSAMGLGCWAIGGPFWKNGQPVGWGQVNDDESDRAIHRALDLGVTFFDTADVYGCGHSERVLGKALAGRRDRVVIATKFGQVFLVLNEGNIANSSYILVKQYFIILQGIFQNKCHLTATDNMTYYVPDWQTIWHI